jgi:polysaccharide biosynthesis/export protein
MISRLAPLGLMAFVTAVGTSGQTVSPPKDNQSGTRCSGQVRSTYLLGPGDEVEISGPELDDKISPTQIDGDGNLQVPLVGRVHVAGLTVQECEQELDKRLSTYIRHPQVAVNLKEVRSQPVSVVGAVNSPGIHQVRGQKTLLEMISLAGGVRPDAGYRVRITRQLEWGCIPLPNATLDEARGFSVGEVNLKEILEAKKPQENIAIFPHDVISVPKAEMIYVIGDVKRSGGFALDQHQSISILQALALAEGLTPTADTRHARILRLNANADQRVEIAVNVKNILKGKSSDVPLLGDDILFIPGSIGKKTTLRAIEAAIQTGSGFAIWHTP